MKKFSVRGSRLTKLNGLVGYGLLVGTLYLVGLSFTSGQSALAPVPANGTPAHRALGLYTGFGENGVQKLATLEQFLGRKVGFVDANTDHHSWSAARSSTKGNFENAGSWKVRPDLRVALTVAIRVDQTGARTNKAGGPELIRKELQDTANGLNDDHFRLFGERLINNGHANAILRIGHEPDINFYPWSLNNGNEDVYKLAFRRAVSVFRSIPGQQFLIDYNTNGSANVAYTTRTGVNTTRAEAGYPGDDVVDIIGVDVYNGTSWQNTKAKLDHVYNMAKSRGKMFSIPEWGLRIPQTGDDPSFIQNMFDWMQATPTSGSGRLLYHAYFWQNKEANLDSAPQSKAKFKQLFGAANITTVGGAPVVPPTPTPPTPPAPTPTPPTPPASAAKPDVIVVEGSIKSIPANPKEGDLVSFEATIRNVGTASTPANIIHGVAFRVNGKIANWSDNTTQSLAPGQSRVVTTNGGPNNKAQWTAFPGSHEIKAVWDDLDRISESNESNNTQTGSVTVTPKVVSSSSDDTKPNKPGRPRAGLLTQSQIMLVWDPVGDNVGVVGYNIYRDGLKIATSTTTSFADTMLESSTSYSYSISAYDAAGNESSRSDVLGVSTTAPTIPSSHDDGSDDAPFNVIVSDDQPAVPISAGEQPVISGSIKLENPNTTSSGSRTTLLINNKPVKTVEGNQIDIDTSVLPNGEHALTLKTIDANGNEEITSRTVSVNNDLNLFERFRNFVFKPFAGRFSGSTMNLVIILSSLLAVAAIAGALVYIIRPRSHRGIL